MEYSHKDSFSDAIHSRNIKISGCICFFKPRTRYEEDVVFNNKIVFWFFREFHKTKVEKYVFSIMLEYLNIEEDYDDSQECFSNLSIKDTYKLCCDKCTVLCNYKELSHCPICPERLCPVCKYHTDEVFSCFDKTKKQKVNTKINIRNSGYVHFNHLHKNPFEYKKVSIFFENIFNEFSSYESNDFFMFQRFYNGNNEHSVVIDFNTKERYKMFKNEIMCKYGEITTEKLKFFCSYLKYHCGRNVIIVDCVLYLLLEFVSRSDYIFNDFVALLYK